ncbi:MAG: sugar nucleotide-binding protein [Bdellovibrio sp.]|nr:sugar nucleotide-binding protein [Bdellovibrio sp.]
MAYSKSVLIVGGSGFIGTHLAMKLRDGYKVFATYNTKSLAIPGVTFLPMNITNQNLVKRIAYTAQPDVIIYTAGSNNFEIAENEPRKAERLHTGGPAAVSNATEIFQPKFIYLSNSYIFDGNKGNYRETDTVLPFTAIGKAKLGGENYIRGRSLNYIILRLSPVIGRGNGKNISFLDHLRIKLDHRERVEFLGNQIHSYIDIYSVINTILHLIEGGPKNKILHFGGLTKLTDYEFAQSFAKRFVYPKELITLRQSSQQKKSSDAVINDFSLNSTQISETMNIKSLLLEESFDLLEKNL